MKLLVILLLLIPTMGLANDKEETCKLLYGWEDHKVYECVDAKYMCNTDKSCVVVGEIEEWDADKFVGMPES